MTTDPRAVRVRIADASGDGMLVVAPAPEPLRMTNPTIGIGPLGGTVIDGGGGASTDPAGDGVLAQGHLPLVDGEPAAVALDPAGTGRYVLDGAGARTLVVLGDRAAGPGGSVVREVLVDGFRFQVQLESERIAALRERATRGRADAAHAGPLAVKAIIPGKVVALSVAVGDAVTAGQQLLVVEAMKMQNELRAPRDGTIDRVGVAVGQAIEIGDLLVVIS